MSEHRLNSLSQCGIYPHVHAQALLDNLTTISKYVIVYRPKYMYVIMCSYTVPTLSVTVSEQTWFVSPSAVRAPVLYFHYQPTVGWLAAGGISPVHRWAESD